MINSSSTSPAIRIIHEFKLFPTKQHAQPLKSKNQWATIKIEQEDLCIIGQGKIPKKFQNLLVNSKIIRT